MFRLLFLSVSALCLLATSSCLLEDSDTKAPSSSVPVEVKAPPVGKDKPRIVPGVDEYRRWLKTSLREPSLQSIPKDQLWTSEALKFVDDAIDAETSSQTALAWSTLANRAANLAQKNCESPYLHLWLGEALLRGGKAAQAAPHLKKAAVKFQGWDYPKLALSLASDALSEALRLEGLSPEIERASTNIAVCAMVEAVVESPSPSQFAAYAGLLDLRSAKFNSKFWRLAASSASKISTYPKWLASALKIKAGIEEFKAAPKESFDFAKLSAIAAGMEALAPERPETPSLALEVLAAAPDPAKDGEAKRLFLKAVSLQFDYLPCYQSYCDFLGARTDLLMAFGRECLATGRFDTFVPRIYIEALLRCAEAEASYNWRAAFLKPGVKEDVERLYLGLLTAFPPDAKAARDTLAMERSLLFAWGLDYEAARSLFSKVPPENSLLEGSFSEEWLPWKPAVIPDFEAELRGFTGVHKETFLQWDAALRDSSPEELYVKLAAKLVAAYINDKPLKGVIRNWTAWRMIGLPAAKVSQADFANPVSYAIKAKRPDVVKFLLDNGYELKKRSREGGALLFLAFSNGMPEDAIRLLVARGADPDFVDPATGESPLTLALSAKMPALAEFIAEMGSDPNIKLPSGNTPLHLATALNMPQALKTLLRRGAKPNVQDAKGDTPLHVAVRLGLRDCAQTLLAKGADPSLKNFVAESALDVASKSGDEAMVALLKDALASVKRPAAH